MSRRTSGRGAPGVRISGGRLRGRVLRVPRDVRPTEGRVREALFSMWREPVEGARVLDLFAGSGAVALEAASRGGLWVLALEKEPRTVAALEEVVRRFGEEGVVAVRRAELPNTLAELAAAGERFDLVFADPPYRYPDYEALLAAAAPLLAPGGELALEHSTRRHPPEEVGGLVRVDQRRYGESSLSFYRHGPGVP